MAIVSPHDRYTDVKEKGAAWLDHGTRMVIGVHRSAVVVRHLTIEDRLDGEDVVPGWRLAVRDLFTMS